MVVYLDCLADLKKTIPLFLYFPKFSSHKEALTF